MSRGANLLIVDEEIMHLLRMIIFDTMEFLIQSMMIPGCNIVLLEEIRHGRLGCNSDSVNGGINNKKNNWFRNFFHQQ